MKWLLPAAVWSLLLVFASAGDDSDVKRSDIEWIRNQYPDALVDGSELFQAISKKIELLPDSFFQSATWRSEVTKIVVGEIKQSRAQIGPKAPLSDGEFIITACDTPVRSDFTRSSLKAGVVLKFSNYISRGQVEDNYASEDADYVCAKMGDLNYYVPFKNIRATRDPDGVRMMQDIYQKQLSEIQADTERRRDEQMRAARDQSAKIADQNAAAIQQLEEQNRKLARQLEDMQRYLSDIPAQRPADPVVIERRTGPSEADIQRQIDQSQRRADFQRMKEEGWKSQNRRP